MEIKELLEFKKARTITYQALADEFGVSESTVRSWTSGRVQVPETKKRMIRRYLDQEKLKEER